MPATASQQATNAYNNLISTFWVRNQFVSRSQYQGGYVTPTTPAQPMSSNPWEYAQAVFACYAMAQSSNSLKSDAVAKIKGHIDTLKSKFPASTWERVGNGSALPAIDDCAWACLGFLCYADVTGDKSVLPIVAGAINAAIARWLDNVTGGGFWYNDAKTEKNSYQAPLVYAMCWYDYLAGVQTFQPTIAAVYAWAMNTLYGLNGGGFWEGVDPTGTPITDNGQIIIQQGSSVTYLAGNMFWSAIAAVQNFVAPSPSYTVQINATAAFMLEYETINGRWLNDRDAATDAAGAWFYYQYAYPQLTSLNQAAISGMYQATALAIDPNATNTFEQFSSDWLAGSFLGCTAAPDYACNNTPVFAQDIMWAMVAQTM